MIGSAASAVQIVPEIAKTAAQVSLFQRTPNYVIPRYDRAYSSFEKWCFRHVPLYEKLYRYALFLRYDWFAYSIVKTSEDNLARRFAMRLFRKLLERSVPDPDTAGKTHTRITRSAANVYLFRTTFYTRFDAGQR